MGRDATAERPGAIVLMSGGLDSCVTAAVAGESHALLGLHATYGQRTADRERRAFEDQCAVFGIDRRLTIDLAYLAEIGGSSLTDPGIEVPEADLDREGIPNTYVPFRNAHLLSAAVSWAESLGIGSIFIGAVEEDSSGYPDCRPVYYAAMNRLIEAGTRPETHIRIETPLIQMRKREIVRRGIELGAPLDKTWSCYQGDVLACGRCDSCALRLRAFQEAGETDPVGYANASQYAKIRETGGLR